MRKCISSAVACAFAAAVIVSSATAKEAADAGGEWRRIPQAVIPQLPAPTIDGVVSRDEWLGAAELGPLKVGTEGVADELQRRVYMGYDAQNIYIAFTLHRPAGSVEPAVPSQDGHVDRTDGGDLAEIMLAPALVYDKAYSFWLFANSAFGEASCTRGKNPAWDTPWNKAARKTADGWEGEVAIPFAAFGLDGPPATDQVWGFDFVDNRRTPFVQLAHWSYRGNLWSAYENFGRIRFQPSPAVRFPHLGDNGAGVAAVEVELANATPRAATCQAELRLYKRKPGSDGGPKSFFANVDSGMSHDAQVEFTKDTTLDASVKFARSFYEPLGDAEVTRTLAIPPGERRSVGSLSATGVGEYLLEYRLLQGETVLSSGVSLFRIEPPLALTLEPYWLYSKLVDVTADIYKLPLTGGGAAHFSIVSPDGSGAPLASTTRTIPAGARQLKAELSTESLKPGFYKVQVVVTDQSGKELARNTDSIRKPEVPAWYRNEHGNRIQVPEPWTAVKSDDAGQVSVWGRDYDLTKGFPSSVRSQGMEVLASPVQLKALVNGKPVILVQTQVKRKAQTPARSVYEIVLKGGPLVVTGEMSVEFDGLIWYDLQMKAADASAITVERMSLEAAIHPQFAELMGRHKFLTDEVLGTQQPKAELNGAPGLLQQSLMPFTPYLWIGNEKGGLGFVAEAPIDWQIVKPSRVMETRPADATGPASLLVHFVQAPKELTRPMRLQFGLQATPIRPAPERHEILNIFQRNGVWADEKEYKRLSDLGCKVLVFYYSWRGNNSTEMGGTPERPVDPKQRELLKQAVQLAHKHGMKVLLFTGWGINATSDNWKQFGLELGRYPIYNQGWGTFGQSAGPSGGYADFMAWGHADLATEYEVDGVLWDSTANLIPDRNLRTGTAWVDDQGRVRPKYAVMATRELYRRVYNIYHGEIRKDGIIYNHCGSMWPINVFADIQNRGEGRPMTAKTLRESWTPFEEFRTEYSAEPFGTLYSGEINDFAKLPMRVSMHLAVTLLHGTYSKEYAIYPKGWTYEYEGRPVIPLWSIFQWLPWDATTKKLYYYQNAAGRYQAVKASPASLLSSAFVSGDGKRALVVVSNLDTSPVAAEVQLEPAALGMPAGGTVHVEDAILKTPVRVDGNRLRLDIDQQRYRLLKVWVEQ